MNFGQFINRLLGPLGLRIHRAKTLAHQGLEFDPVFARLQRRRIPVTTVIDVGASDGNWSRRLRKFYPDAKYHLIEANEVHEPALRALAARHAHTSYTLAAAADVVGFLYFDDRNPWGGLASHEETDHARLKIPCTTIDAEIAEHRFEGPYLLKLDTHGFELPIIEGAEQTLQTTNIVVMEVYNFHLTDQSLTFWEMCGYLAKKGFRPFDIMEPMHRPRDGAFWQFDIVFLKSGRTEFRDNQYA